MTGFILKCITSACSLQTEVYRYSLYSRVGDRCFSIKNASDSGSPLVEHYWIRSDHVLCTWDKNEKDDFGDDDKRNPTKLCLASASLHQHRSPAAVLLWLWRKQQFRDKGKTEIVMLSGKPATIGDFRMFIWKSSVGSFARGDWSLCYPLRKGLSSSTKSTPDLHDAKLFAGYSNLRNKSYCTLISSISIYFRAGFHLLPSRCHFSIEQYLRVPAQGGGGHFWRLHVSMIKMILSFIKSGHPSNHPTKPRWVRRRLGALRPLLRSWVGQSRSAAPSQTCAIKGMLTWKRHGVFNEWPKTFLGKARSQIEAKNDELMICSLTSPNSTTFEVSKWRWWKVCTPPSSAHVGRRQLWTPPRRSESFPHSTLSASDCDKPHSISFPNKPKM